VKTVVDHPRRLEELAGLLDDRDVMVRERAAATMARLAESHPARLVRITEKLKVGLADDSAYVRWHVVYALGRLGFRFPAQAPGYLPGLAGCLTDDNRVVRSLALRALTDLASRKPEIVLEVFSSKKQALPSPLDRILRGAGRRQERPGRPVS
jgi:HEAT repeat protein